MERVPNIDWKTLEEARTPFSKSPNLTKLISTPQSKVIYIIVPRDLLSYAKEYYGNTAEVISMDYIYEEPFMLEEKKVPFWQQINKRERR